VGPPSAVIERKLGYLNRYIHDLDEFAGLDDAAKRQAHYAIEPAVRLYRAFADWCIAQPSQ
jgi:hypothetical protein